MSDKGTRKVHWRFWVIGVAALVWNVMGGMNFLMQMDPDSLANYPEAARSLVESRPTWATAAFALAVFGGVLGCVLLLLKKTTALYLFILSLMGVIATNIHTFRINTSTDILIGSLLAFIVALFLVWYTKLLIRKGWLV